MATKSINIPLKVHKRFKRRDLARKFGEMGFTKGAEVGVRWGKYSKALCDENPKLESLLSVDPYTVVYEDVRTHRYGQRSHDKIYRKAQQYLKGTKAQIIKKTSLDAVVEVPDASLDFVYIDGSHQFDYVMTDIITWGWKVRTGGVLSGHDYYKFNFGDVVRAVDNYATIHKVKEINLTDEYTPSWWFVKTW